MGSRRLETCCDARYVYWASANLHLHRVCAPDIWQTALTPDMGSRRLTTCIDAKYVYWQLEFDTRYVCGTSDNVHFRQIPVLVIWPHALTPDTYTGRLVTYIDAKKVYWSFSNLYKQHRATRLNISHFVFCVCNKYICFSFCRLNGLKK
jgi:hypothetical protein